MKLLSFSELRPKKGIPYTRQHLARLENAGRFPKRVKFPGGNRVGWIEEEIDAMQAAMAAARDAPPALPGKKPEPSPGPPNIITIARSTDRLQPLPGISKK